MREWDSRLPRWRLLALALSGLASVAAAIAAAAAPPDAVPAAVPAHPRAIVWRDTAVELRLPRARRVELEVGPVVYLVPDASLPLVEIAVALRDGSLLDPPDRTGLASLTGAMLRRGGVVGLAPTAFDLAIDDLGARIDSSAGVSRGGASLSVLSSHLVPALDLFFQMLAEPAFEEGRVENAVENLVESMSRRDQNPLGVVEREWEWLLYGDRHASTRPLTPASVSTLRSELLAEHHRRFWRPERMIVAVSGDFTESEIVARLDQGFSSWPQPSDPAESTERAWPPSRPPSGVEPGLYHYESPSPQAKVAFGRRLDNLLPWDHPDRPVLDLTAEILGGSGAISRLGGRLRTAEGLVYRISAEINPGALWPGELRIVFDTAAGNVAPALRAALEEIDRLRDSPVHPMELDIARRTLLSRLMLDLDTAEEVAGRSAENELLGRPTGYWDTYRQGLEKARVEDVRRVAGELLDPGRFVYLVVGPWSEVSGAGVAPPPGELERVVGRRVVQLPRRDPLTMEPVVASAPEE